MIIDVTALLKVDDASTGYNVEPNAPVEIRDSDGNLAIIYSDKDLTTPISQPANCDSKGQFLCYAKDDAYTVTIYFQSGSVTRPVTASIQDVRYLTISEAQTESLKVGQYVRLSDRKEALFITRPVGMIANGRGVIGLTDGKSIEIQLESQVDPAWYGASGDGVALDTAELQDAINTGLEVLITRPHKVAKLNLVNNSTLSFSGEGKLIGVSNNQILDADNKRKLTLNNPVIEGVYTGTPNLAEHAIKFTDCTQVIIRAPEILNVGGNGIQLERCTRSTIYDLDVVNVGFLGFIGVDCTKVQVLNGYVQDAADAFSVQHKGGRECLLMGIEVIRPNSCGIIVNTNQTSGRTSEDCNIVDCHVTGDAATQPSSNTKGMILVQMSGGTVRGCTCSNNTRNIGAGMQVSGVGVRLIANNVKDISAIGYQVTGDTTVVEMVGNTAERCQDRGLRHQGGRLTLGSGNRLSNNGLALASLPNIEVESGAARFSMFGSELEVIEPGSNRYNILLQAGAYDVNISSNTFVRNNAPDIASTTGELRTDLTGKLSIHSNGGAVVALTTGWAASFEIKNRLLQFEDYQRVNAPTTGTWVKGDKMQNSNPATGQPIGFVCTAEPVTWQGFGSVN